MTDQNVDSQPTIYEFPGYDKAPFDVRIVVHHGGSVTQLHTHRYILCRNSWFEKRLRREALSTAPPFLFGLDVLEEKQVMSVHYHSPCILRLFVKYLYNSELEEQEVVSAVDDMVGLFQWPVQYQYKFRCLLGYASLGNLGKIFDSPQFDYLLTDRFDSATQQMEPNNLSWWIEWYHINHTDDWNEGSHVVIAEAVLRNKVFLFHDEFERLIGRCPALGTAILKEQTKQLEESQSFVGYFRDQKQKKAGWFAVHEPDL